MPLQAGDYAIDAVATSASARVNFFSPGDVKHPEPVAPEATEGRLVIDTVTDAEVTGGLRARFDSYNDINGRFELALVRSP
ncbi:MAG TPA: hypothetical protein VIX73_31295 [Kofleriaceae bacterium]|jgi:hypothetical protein